MTIDRTRSLCLGVSPATVTRRTCEPCPNRWTCAEVGLRQSLYTDPTNDFYVYGGLSVRARHRLLAENRDNLDEALIAAWVEAGRPANTNSAAAEPAEPAEADPATIGQFHPYKAGEALERGTRRGHGRIGQKTSDASHLAVVIA